MKKITAIEKARLIAQFAAEKKGEDIVLMEMRNISTMYEWFVLISGSSSRRINAISNTIQRKLAKERIFSLHIEGKQDAHWVLLDYNDVIVHIFHNQIREFYGLERLWSDARIERFENKCLAKMSQKG